MTDPIADMLTRIRNANQNRASKVEIPASKVKLEIAKILKDEGYYINRYISENTSENNRTKEKSTTGIN